MLRRVENIQILSVIDFLVVSSEDAVARRHEQYRFVGNIHHAWIVTIALDDFILFAMFEGLLIKLSRMNV